MCVCLCGGRGGGTAGEHIQCIKVTGAYGSVRPYHRGGGLNKEFMV